MKKYVLTVLALVSVIASGAENLPCGRVERMSWGYDVIIENKSVFEGFKEVQINGSRNLFYIIGGSIDRIFRSVVISGLVEYPKINITSCSQ